MLLSTSSAVCVLAVLWYIKTFKKITSLPDFYIFMNFLKRMPLFLGRRHIDFILQLFCVLPSRIHLYCEQFIKRPLGTDSNAMEEKSTLIFFKIG